nr:hypothetical protein [Tanacetum cinerariifolium]
MLLIFKTRKVFCSEHSLPPGAAGVAYSSKIDILLDIEDCCSDKWDTLINIDKSWMATNRTNRSYINRVAAFIDYAVHNLQKMGNIDPREEVQLHLFRNGIDLSYTKWNKHRENDEPSIIAPKPINATIEFVDGLDFASDIPTVGPATVEMANATKDNFDEDGLVKFQELLLDAEKPLYEECHDFTMLYAIVKLLNLKGKYGCSDKFFTKLLGLLKKMLPAGNKMVEKTYQAKKDTYSQAWHTIDEKFPEFAEDLRNLRLRISADGFNINTGNRHHSTGVDTYDASTKDNFNLCAVVLWTINDYPALGHYVAARTVDSKVVKQKKAFNGQQEFLVALNLMTGEQIYNENVAESLIGTLLNVSGKTKDEVNARLDLAELGVKPELFAMQEEDKTTLPPIGHVRNRNKLEGCIAEEIIVMVNATKDNFDEDGLVKFQELLLDAEKPLYEGCHDFTMLSAIVKLLNLKGKYGCSDKFFTKLLGLLKKMLPAGKTKDEVNARLDLAELGVKPELFAMQEEDKTTLPPTG